MKSKINLILFFVGFLSINFANGNNVDVCMLPKDAGRCRALKPHFYFNSDTKRCESFFYGGCEGNGNNFRSLKECHESCHGHLSDPVDVSLHLRGAHCLLPPVTESRMGCMAFFQRFTFNSKSLECEPYIYGGCGATANLYLSREECKASCLHGELKLAMRPRPVPTGAMKRGFKAMAASSDIESENEIAAIPQPEEKNICKLPPVRPSPMQCLGFMSRWTYDSKIGTCVEYIYGGCFGTANLFNTKEECEAKCSKTHLLTESKTANICGKPIDKGPCKALKFKYGFNRDTNRCEKFAYGGCQGNENRFNSLEECVNLCGGYEPQEKLDCSAAICNKQDAAFHRAKGCQPILKTNECCPSSWDCSIWEVRMANQNKCFWANEDIPRGKYYEIGERVPEASNPGMCRMACVCTEGYGGGAEIICASPGCYWPGIQGKGQICKTLFKDLHSCCASSTKCDSELEELHTCNVDNTTYYAGEKIKPKDDPCKVCLCDEQWTGDYDDRQFCQNIDCGLGYQTSTKLKQGCQPIYREDTCCPTTWVCPERAVLLDPFITDEEAPPKTESMVICPPGVEIRAGDHLNPPIPPVEPLGDSPMVQLHPPPTPKASDVCLLPKTLGPCHGFQEAWYFDIDSKKCHKFKTGGPGSGGNLFESEESCLETCKEYSFDSASAECEFSVSGDGDEFFAVPMIMCFQEHKRFRFNKKLGKCEEFVDMACGVTGNGYKSMDECEAKCFPHDHEVEEEETEVAIKGKEEKCNLVAKVGPCKSRMSRFFYDTHAGKCKLFYYGGCQGNENNFLDERTCIETCVTEDNLPRALHLQDLHVESPCKQKGGVTGPCRAQRPRFYFDDDKKVCRIFFYGGCGGNDNNFANLKECSSACQVDETAQADHLKICELPRQASECAEHGPKKRYHYDAENFLCQSFEYTGCDKGEEGNFKSLADCNLECVLPRTMKGLEDQANQPSIEARSVNQLSSDSNGDDVSENEISNDPCLQDRFVGMCRAAIRRFYFDKESKECKKFIYGGCGGNDNNFASLSDCENHCSHHIKEKKTARAEKSKFFSRKLSSNPICHLPVEVGPCEALIPSYFFNTGTKRCENFIYGGCRGNENRFLTLEDCESACVPASQTDAATLPAVLPEATLKCHLGNETYNVGDLLRFGNNRCRTCKCISPPGLFCVEKVCKTVKLIKTGNSICEPVFDEDSCCIVDYKCSPKEDHSEDCTKRICAMFDFMNPPDQTCKSLSDGCCQAGIMCTPNN